MRTISDLFTPDTPRNEEQQLKLIQAYHDVFTGHGSQEQADVVLVDILKASGYYHTTPIGVTSETLQGIEGGRRVGAHILQRLSVDTATLRAAQSAVGRESRADVQKGEL